MTTTGAFNAFHAKLTDLTKAPGFGLVPMARKGGRNTFGNIGDPRPGLGLLVDLEMNGCAGCRHVMEASLPAGVNRIRGIFERRLAEFLPDEDPRNVGNKSMQGQMWDHIRYMTVKDAVHTLRNARAVNWVQSGRAGVTYLGTHGFEFIRTEIMEQASRVQGLDRADHIIASAAIYNELTQGADEPALHIAQGIAEAAGIHAEEGEHDGSAPLYELAASTLPRHENAMRSQYETFAGLQWMETLKPGHYGSASFEEALFRTLYDIWGGGDLIMLAEVYKTHADSRAEAGGMTEAGMAMVRHVWARTETLRRRDWTMENAEETSRYWRYLVNTLELATGYFFQSDDSDDEVEVGELLERLKELGLEGKRIIGTL